MHTRTHIQCVYDRMVLVREWFEDAGGRCIDNTAWFLWRWRSEKRWIHTPWECARKNTDGRLWTMEMFRLVDGFQWWRWKCRGDNNGNGGERRQALAPPGVGTPSPPTWVTAVLPGLPNTPREAALADRGFALEGLAEFWATAAAAAKVARFCNCRALIPGERSQRGWGQTWGGRLSRSWTGT